MNTDKETVGALLAYYLQEKIINRIQPNNPISLLMLNIANRNPLYTYLSRASLVEMIAHECGNSIQGEWHRELMVSQWKDTVYDE